MKIGIVGLPLSGKTELFEALTGAQAGTAFHQPGNGQERHAVVKVPDERLERLNRIFQPMKKTPAGVEYIDFAGLDVSEDPRPGFSNRFLGTVRTANALLVILRGFKDERVPHPLKSIGPVRDLKAIDSEFILSDLVLIESRMDRLEKQAKSQKNDRDIRELKVLGKCKSFLEEEKPLRLLDLEREEEVLIRGFRFLTQKPLIIVVNIDEDDIAREEEILKPFGVWMEQKDAVVLCLSAKIEKEIQQLSDEEAVQFLKDFGIAHPVRARLIAASYQLMGLISFFTVGSDEVKAWTIQADTPAVRAAGAVHSDIERGFIRAEVVGYDDFVSRGTLVQCRNEGVLRLEGKDYRVADGDIINYRFAI
jgi:GTP-binding protein YchF